MTEYDEGNNLTNRNIYGPGPDEILMRGLYWWAFYHADKQGSVTALLDINGAILEKYTYDVFGQPTVTDGNGGNPRGASWYGNRFMFTGREYLAWIACYDYRNRMYRPSLGRFLQTDPKGFEAGDINLFRYCTDDPVNRSDPTGLMSVSATLWNRLAWFQSGSLLRPREDDLLKQGQARFAEPTGNYKEPLEKHIARNGETGGDPGITRYTVSDVQEVENILVIKPTLNWWVQKNYIHTTVVQRELEHVNRWLHWQMKGAGAEMVRGFNSQPRGKQKLAEKAETARFLERQWQDENIHANGRHTLDVRPEKSVEPAALEKLIQKVGPVEFPHVLNDLGLE